MGSQPRRVLYGPARGLVFELDFEHQLRFWLGLYETEIANALRRFARRGRCIYNVGADVGFQALTAAKLSDGRVVAFEPRQDAVDALECNLALNPGLMNSVQIIQTVVGARDEPTQQTIDSVIARGAPVPDVLLIDVDGAEVDVLRGAQDLLGYHHPDLIIETHSAALEHECSEILTASGYKPTIVRQRRLLPDYRPTPHNRWMIASRASDDR